MSMREKRVGVLWKGVIGLRLTLEVLHGGLDIDVLNTD